MPQLKAWLASRAGQPGWLVGPWMRGILLHMLTFITLCLMVSLTLSWDIFLKHYNHQQFIRIQLNSTQFVFLRCNVSLSKMNAILSYIKHLLWKIICEWKKSHNKLLTIIHSVRLFLHFLLSWKICHPSLLTQDVLSHFNQLGKLHVLSNSFQSINFSLIRQKTSYLKCLQGRRTPAVCWSRIRWPQGQWSHWGRTSWLACSAAC
jgi:hypothetical protein